MWHYIARIATDVLQAELQLLLVRHEVLSHLHRQVVERQDAVEERQHLSAKRRFGISPEKTWEQRSSDFYQSRLQVPPRQTSSCPAPGGSGRHTPLTTRRS